MAEGNMEFKFRRLLEVEQVVTDLKFISEYLAENDIFVTDDGVLALLEQAYKREIHNRDYNQATSQFDKRLKLDKEL